ncbi:glycosyltransferase family 4 protein [Maribacter sp. M208]|uniref:glycosyltransferase family 4 protein n=1 Tax=Maribacter huludaoensis TaxID=3030010 RepID=UPI0023ECF084|nr:glycosyltransferase family 4 protein [Maribacter huludaoensis]MDF4222882.1 glycosyltransferase family 4 protein [Maribacter huludaoensis]
MKKIKVLWVINELFPEVADYLKLETSYVGGWVNGLANNIKTKESIELHISTVHQVDSIKQFYDNKINFHVVPSVKNNQDYDKNLEKEWKVLISEVQPDVIHIHGTEYAHGLALMNSCPNQKYVISIQGLVSVYVKYYLANLSFSTILKNVSFRDVIRFDTIWQGKSKYKKRGKFELQYLTKTKNVMGRTDWDFAHAKSINQQVNYHFCNETLRDSFYTEVKWKFNKIEKFSVFLSQCSYPIKGLHQMLEALTIIKKYNPDVTLNIAGENILAKNKIKITGYAKLIQRLITKYNLKDNINFLGILNEHQMKDQYLKSHVFVCPSSIENSPNSLGEAQILGVPSIASYVGGNHNLVNHGHDGYLYRFEESEILAQLIIKLFNKHELCERISSNAIVSGELRHNRKINANRNLEIYKNIYIHNIN